MRKLLVLLAITMLALMGCGGDDDVVEPVDDVGLEDTEPDVTDTEAEAETEPETTEAETTEAETTDGEAAPPELEGSVNDQGTAQLTGDSIAITAGDFFFDPTFVEAQSGATATVTVTNDGAVPHTFTIDAQGVDEVLDPGQSAEVDVTVDGTVNFICRFHIAQGMQGAFFTSSG